ncbi:hypothetical protein ACJ41O_015220 [Fusarium nematophilum]
MPKSAVDGSPAGLAYPPESYSAVDIGDPLVVCKPEEVSTVTIEDPIQTLHVFTRAVNMRSLRVTALNGESTNIDSKKESKPLKGMEIISIIISCFLF